MLEIACALVGEPGCGKSSAVSKYCLDEYPAATGQGESLPAINSAAEDPDTGEIVSLSIRDTRRAIPQGLRRCCHRRSYE